MRILLAIFLLLAPWALAGAKLVDLTNENASIDLPDGWNVTQRPVDLVPTSAVPILNASDAAGTVAVTIMLCADPNRIAVTDPNLVSGIKSSISNSAVSKGNSVQFTAESPMNVNGVPAYVIQDGVTLPGPRLVLCHTYLVAANQKLYLIITQTLDSGQVSALEAIATTFRFATPPDVPTPRISHRRLKIALLAVAVVVGLLVMVGVGFYLRKRS